VEEGRLSAIIFSLHTSATDRALAGAVPVTHDYYCSELLAAAYQRMGLLPTDRACAVAQGVKMSASLASASTYWPTAWCAGGVVDLLLPTACHLGDEVSLECRKVGVAGAATREPL